MKEKLKLVYIEWLDANSEENWSTQENINSELTRVFDIGWIVNETKDCLTLCSQFTDDACSGNRTNIPKSCIKYKKVITQKLI